jgi:hypothetical protein
MARAADMQRDPLETRPGPTTVARCERNPLEDQRQAAWRWTQAAGGCYDDGSRAPIWAGFCFRTSGRRPTNGDRCGHDSSRTHRSLPAGRRERRLFEIRWCLEARRFTDSSVGRPILYAEGVARIERVVAGGSGEDQWAGGTAATTAGLALCPSRVAVAPSLDSHARRLT